MYTPPTNTLTHEPAPNAGHAVRFRFPVTWSGLSSYGTGKAERPRTARAPAVISAPAPPAADRAAIAMSAPLTSLRESPAPVISPASSATQWEMVIPKMARPAARATPAPARTVAAPPPAPVEAKSPDPTAPSLYTLSESAGSRVWNAIGFGWKLAAIAGAVVGLAVWVSVRPESSDSTAQVESLARVSTRDWTRRATFQAGSRQARQIILYGPSREESDYRFQFAWTPDSRGVGWILRARDNGNYSAGKLRLLPSKDSFALIAERFSVAAGSEGPHSQKVFTLPRSASPVVVRLDAAGPAFTLSVQGSPVDYWNDQRLPSGSLGFYEEQNWHATVQSVQVTFFKKGGLKTMAAPVP